MIALLLCLSLQDPEIDRLIRGLGDDSFDVRMESERALIERGTPATRALLRFVDDADPERRGRVRRILSVLRLAEETRLLTGNAVGARAAELKALGSDPFEILKREPDARYVPHLTDIVLFDFDEDRRAAAVEALIAIGGKRVYPALLWALRSPPDRGERIVAWLALHADLTMVGELERMGRQKMMRAMVVLGAVKMRYPDQPGREPVDWKPISAEPILYAAVQGTTREQRIRGLRAIATGLSSDVRGLKILRGALEGQDEGLRYRAAEAFARVSWGEAVASLAKRLADSNETPRVRKMCAAALARNGSMVAKTALLSALESESVEIRLAAAEALGRTGDVTLVSLAEKALETQDDPRVSEALRRAIRALRGR